MEFSHSSSLLAGTYTTVNPSGGPPSEGIYHLAFDSDRGLLGEPQLWARTPNPSWLLPHPTLPVMYCANECPGPQQPDEGTITVFARDTAEELAVVPSGGADPCHLAALGPLDGPERGETRCWLAAANYSSGTTAVFALDARGVPRVPPQLLTGPSPRRGSHPERQEGPHAHWVGRVPGIGTRLGAIDLVTVDLGGDALCLSRLDHGLLRPSPEPAGGILGLDAGCGPRHLAFHPTLSLAYVLCELEAVLEIWTFASAGSWSRLAGISCLPATSPQGFPGGASIVVHPDGRRLYCSLRGDYDAIAAFNLDDDGMAHLLGMVPSGGASPRSLVPDPSGHWLLAFHQSSGSVAVHRIGDDPGLPALVSVRQVPTPVHGVFTEI